MNALIAVLQSLDVSRHDQIIPGRGEPYVDPTTKETHIRFTRPGEPGEYHVRLKIEYMPPYEARGQ